ncbi:hypothetical protein [Acetobacterium bakii]|uniref:Zn-finger containing protein n=1 Tax=Acetobacterium bakii TaxID=52689 RepID=A0A0L6TXV8_9FIRM|nr:hypothetical protein [Acetobacterium bakii]KNZ41101.1 Zn-finger containing protein [Acetobacterium bakii]
MKRFKEKLVEFMSGRYGMDQLYYAMLLLALGIMMVNMKVDNLILMILSDGIILLMILRSFSRNISKRARENGKFLKIWNPVKRNVRIFIRRIKEIRVYRYRKCPNCKKTLQLPIKRGKNTVKCPKCQEKFNVRVIL